MTTNTTSLRKDYVEWTSAELLSLPEAAGRSIRGPYRGVVVLPLETTHESGYQHMAVIGFDENRVPVAVAARDVDVIEFKAEFGGAASGDQFVRWPLKAECLPVSRGIAYGMHILELFTVETTGETAAISITNP